MTLTDAQVDELRQLVLETSARGVATSQLIVDTLTLQRQAAEKAVQATTLITHQGQTALRILQILQAAMGARVPAPPEVG